MSSIWSSMPGTWGASGPGRWSGTDEGEWAAGGDRGLKCGVISSSAHRKVGDPF